MIVWVQRERERERETENLGGLVILWDVDVNLKVQLQRIADESCCHCVNVYRFFFGIPDTCSFAFKERFRIITALTLILVCHHSY